MSDIQERSNKKISKLDGPQVLKEVFNQEDKSLTTSTFLTAKIGNKIIKTLPSSTQDQFSYYDSDNQLLYTILITYTDVSKSDISTVERTA